jgi:3',5'-cyclic AMP phosphodiesterase CpdA
MNKKVSSLCYYVILLLACLTAAFILTSCNSCNTFLGKTKSFTFVQISDTQLGFSDYEKDIDSFRQAVIQINDLDPSFVVICGDLVNNASDKSFSDFKDIKNSLKMPCYCVPGNHDIDNKPTQESLRRYRKIIGEDYFVVEHIGTTFIFVNTQLWKEVVEGESEKQDVWLKEKLKLASEKKQQVFIVGHYPLFCKKADEAEEYMNLPFDKRMELLSLYDQNNVIAVLHGHTHTLALNNYNDIQMVGAETTSKNFDKKPLGFRLWYVEDKLPPKHEFVPLGRPNP